ncbi:protein ASYMMETRIC LEAVES 2-like [Tasmannia lanceolata]|uniref:protein ASYMMETRIC LEAVES 2-like n=1 Tax=Tasmannia lanceolata TaxID=3420 RepID=UPI004064213B
MAATNSPCAACKFLRRKCQPDCDFAPYFPPDQPQKFANVHKVFGASNVTKLLRDLHPHQREDAVNSLAYEADMRLRDPVYGCVGVISLLQHQLRQVQMDLTFMKTELSRYQNIGLIGNAPIGIGLGRDQFFAREQQIMMRNYDAEMARLGVNGAYDAGLLAMNVSANIGQLGQFPHPRAGGDDRRGIGPS